MLGWKALEVVPGSGRARVQLEASDSFTNGLGTVQGGFLAAMLDYTLSSALATTYAADEMGPTIEMKVNFLRAADPGSYVGEAHLVHRGAAIAFLEGSLAAASGVVVATATMTSRIIKVPH
jgi:uncharacterized protein (TIGR00369 family)